MSNNTTTKQILLTRRSAAHWRVTFNHPPLNIFGPETSYNLREPVRYPHNGRTLTDDVVDVFLSMYTNGKVTGDKVGPHRDLLDGFPYLGPPHGFTPKGIKENL